MLSPLARVKMAAFTWPTVRFRLWQVGLLLTLLALAAAAATAYAQLGDAQTAGGGINAAISAPGRNFRAAVAGPLPAYFLAYFPAYLPAYFNGLIA